MEPAHAVHGSENGSVARCDIAPGSTCGLAEARGITDALHALGRGRVPLLVDMPEMGRFEGDAREHFVHDQGGVTAVALLAGSPVSRMLANFFIGVQRLPVPIRMFTDQAAALQWLEKQR